MIIPLIVSLFLGLATAETNTVNINDIVDLNLNLGNRLSVAANGTVAEYGSGLLGLLEYEGAVGIGLDSLYRTGDCTIQFNGDSITYNYNIGQHILAVFFRKITQGDIAGSGYFRAHNNSLEYTYDVSYYGATCRVRIHALSLSLDNVEAYIQKTSWSTSDGDDFQHFVHENLLPVFNRRLSEKSRDIEANLETTFCKNPNQQQPTLGLDILRQYLLS